MEGHALVSLTAKRASQKRNESLGGYTKHIVFLI